MRIVLWRRGIWFGYWRRRADSTFAAGGAVVRALRDDAVIVQQVR